MDGTILAHLRTISLPHLAQDNRFHTMDRLDSYYCNRQYEHLKYDWDGRFSGYGDQADIAPGWYVPLKRRRPAVRLQVAKLIVSRFTAMLLGEDHFPTFVVEGDEEAEDFVRTLVSVSKFRIKLAEARDKGGACGTACMSFAFVQGRPRVDVHRAKHVKVLRWADRYDLRPAVALKCYRYDRSVMRDGKPQMEGYFYARLWTEHTETVWEPIPERLAKSGDWANAVPSYTVRHDYGECPVYWAQNLPDSDQVDGLSDFDGLGDEIDEINRLVSSTSKGTIANVDPTLVVMEDPGANTGNLRKGSENAIFAKGGAKYLELQGTSIKTAMELARELLQYSLDVAGVVLGEPDKLSGAAKSAAALRIIYQPMLNQCDKLRGQYGEGLAIPMLQGMLRAARKLGHTGSGGQVYVTEDGRRVQERPVVLLPPRVEGEGDSVRMVARTPGSSDAITLQWPRYFQPTAQDVAASVKAASDAKGTLVSGKTATRYVAGYFGIADLEAELEDMAKEEEDRAALFPGPELAPGGLEELEDDEDASQNADEPEE